MDTRKNIRQETSEETEKDKKIKYIKESAGNKIIYSDTINVLCKLMPNVEDLPQEDRQTITKIINILPQFSPTITCWGYNDLSQLQATTLEDLKNKLEKIQKETICDYGFSDLIKDRMTVFKIYQILFNGMLEYSKDDISCINNYIKETKLDVVTYFDDTDLQNIKHIKEVIDNNIKYKNRLKNTKKTDYPDDLHKKFFNNTQEYSEDDILLINDCIAENELVSKYSAKEVTEYKINTLNEYKQRSINALEKLIKCKNTYQSLVQLGSQQQPENIANNDNYYDNRYITDCFNKIIQPPQTQPHPITTNVCWTENKVSTRSNRNKLEPINNNKQTVVTSITCENEEDVIKKIKTTLDTTFAKSEIKDKKSKIQKTIETIKNIKFVVKKTNTSTSNKSDIYTVTVDDKPDRGCASGIKDLVSDRVNYWVLKNGINMNIVIDKTYRTISFSSVFSKDNKVEPSRHII